MKKLLVVLVVLTLVVSAGVASAATIRNSKHDLSSSSSATVRSATINEICVFCHTPHSADTTAGMPLWNRSASTSVYTLYTGVSYTITSGQPGPTSKACLSCHDGTVAYDALLNLNGAKPTPVMGPMAAGFNLIAEAGTNLSNDHPVGFNPVTQNAAHPGITADYLASQTALPLFGGNLECATCHAVHDPANGKFLRMSNAGSALCLVCHNK